MVTIGPHPILWHIMSYYRTFGHNDFIVPVGFKGDLIRRWVLDQHVSESTFTYNLKNGKLQQPIKKLQGDWDITVVESGMNTQTAGRLRKALSFAEGERVFATYGDGLSDVNLNELLEFHISHGKIATVTAVTPPPRFGRLQVTGDFVTSFGEKPSKSEGRINGGFFIFEPDILNYLLDDFEPFEKSPLEKLAADKQLMAFQHDGFWHPMDTIRDRIDLEKLWAEPNPPWRRWVE